MIRRLLVANRGEIARRVFATCRAMGVETVAVYADPDAGEPHVREADRGVRLPGSAASETYLRIEAIVDAARRAGADAVHPGYGFLSERADFAEAVISAGLTWVGPPPDAIAAMGSKLHAKRLVSDAGVPLLPSTVDAAEVTEFPVLVKASAGGGGRGMRVVRDRAGLAGALAAARREAQAAFGDGTVFCERYVERARHVEVQVFADAHGGVLALGERECSIQRRHQKLIEESPSPAVTPQLRHALFAAATAAAKAVGYVGAGTVEFLLAPSGEFFFLEMNTRLQVEHPVTECVLGVDLVRWQLLVAEGAPLPVAEPPVARGHAIEARLYAEEPAHSFRPTTGILHHFSVPEVAGAFRPLDRYGLRLDAGVADGSVVGVHYDAMLAKLIAWAPTRGEAARVLAAALHRARIHGVATNRDLLVRVLRADEFVAGAADTALLDRRPDLRVPLLSTAEELALPCLAAALSGAAARRDGSGWASLAPSGWRNVPSAPQTVGYDGPAGPVEVRYRLDRDGDLCESSVNPGDAEPVRLLDARPGAVTLEVSGARLDFTVRRVGNVSYVDGPDGGVTLTQRPRFPVPEPAVAEGSLVAPLPGTVSRVLAGRGQRVEAGAPLLIIEAMKLEHQVCAPGTGVLADLRVAAGDRVDAGTVLAVITPD